MRPIDEIIVHCAATRPDWWKSKSLGQKIAEVRRWHTAAPPVGRGWSDAGYHFLIDRNGRVGPGRPLERIGAHVVGHNTGTIGICLFGGKSFKLGFHQPAIATPACRVLHQHGWVLCNNIC